MNGHLVNQSTLLIWKKCKKHELELLFITNCVCKKLNPCGTFFRKLIHQIRRKHQRIIPPTCVVERRLWIQKPKYLDGKTNNSLKLLTQKMKSCQLNESIYTFLHKVLKMSNVHDWRYLFRFVTARLPSNNFGTNGRIRDVLFVSENNRD